MKMLIRALAAWLAVIGTAAAQSYPTKPVKLIVPFPPGGNTDIVGRLIADKLSTSFGQQVYVENRAGAGGTIGAEAAAKSPNDGYALFFSTTGTLASAPSMQPNLRYDPVKDFAPIATLANAPVVVLVRDELPAKNLAELIQLAKAKPGTLKFGSAGTGHFVHIAGEMFKSAAHVDMLHVPYKGVSQALVDMLGGRIDVMFDAPAQYEPHLRTGKVRALAVAAPKRLSRLPDVPTTAEAGLPRYVLASWFGLAAPAGTPAEIVNRINADVQKALAAPDVVETMAKLGLEPGGGTPRQYAEMIVDDLAQWRAAVKAAGIKLE
ncbi:MAG TPA: tripartite tricarboxylate transporter substrate binding protein [Burkholderiales bacterium]|jgi:tripartite-type tricarboxylate transporter receptor subunit TctC|nr:tripartite tricarboxylate transporter substrate binding protein [Burkholderiales bacterium]